MNANLKLALQFAVAAGLSLTTTFAAAFIFRRASESVATRVFDLVPWTVGIPALITTLLGLVAGSLFIVGLMEVVFRRRKNQTKA